MSWKNIVKSMESKILREIEKEGGALGMKNLKQFGEESEIKRVLAEMEKEGKVFMHKDGDIYTHEPRDDSNELGNHSKRIGLSTGNPRLEVKH